MIVFRKGGLALSRSLRSEVDSLIRAQYASSPEYLWAKYPTYAVYRHTVGRKWFAVIMDVPCEKLGLEREGSAEILNVKVSPLMAGSLEREGGILPAYHMKKGAWVSVLLNGSVSMEQILALIGISFELTAEKPKKRR